MDNISIGVFDQVQLITTKNVSYLSAPVGSTVSPKGIWTVSGFIDDGSALCIRESIVIRIPISDLKLVKSYNFEVLKSRLGNLSDGKSTKGKKRDV